MGFPGATVRNGEWRVTGLGREPFCGLPPDMRYGVDGTPAVPGAPFPGRTQGSGRRGLS